MSALNTLLPTIIPMPAMVKYLEVNGLPIPNSDAGVVNLVVRTSNVMTQGNVSALVINLMEGATTSDQLDEILAKAFPDSKAANGDKKRHGKHYLCLARTGKLPGCNFKPAKENGPKAKVTEIDPKVAELEAKLAALEARVAAAQGATSAAAMKKALAGE